VGTIPEKLGFEISTAIENDKKKTDTKSVTKPIELSVLTISARALLCGKSVNK
jgi:hypothetical protein